MLIYFKKYQKLLEQLNNFLKKIEKFLTIKLLKLLENSCKIFFLILILIKYFYGEVMKISLSTF